MGKFIEEFAEGMGWKVEGDTAYGVVQGYAFNTTRNMYGIATTIVWLGDMGPVTVGLLQEFFKANKKEHRIAQLPRLIHSGISITQNNPVGKVKAEEIRGMIQAFAAWLAKLGVKPGCTTCGKAEQNAFYTVNGVPIYLCPECGGAVTEAKEKELVAESKGNNILGIVGAVLGGIVGLIPWVLVGMAGRFSAICGLLLGFCIYYGFKIFKGKLHKKVFVILTVIIIAIIMTFMAEMVTQIVLTVQAYPEAGFGRIVGFVFSIPFDPTLAYESGVWGDIGLAYLFSAIGVGIWAFNYSRQRKKEQAGVKKTL